MKDEYQTNAAMIKLQMQMALDTIIASSPEIIASHKEWAKLVHSYYTSLVESGFTDVQALDIVKHHGWNPPMPK